MLICDIPVTVKLVPYIVVVVVVVVLTSNRSFYPTTPTVHAVSVMIHPREIQFSVVTDSDREKKNHE